MNDKEIEYRVGPIREAGLLARWTKTRNGRPCIVARTHDNGAWEIVCAKMWERAKEVGMRAAYVEQYKGHRADAYALADFFPTPGPSRFTDC